MTKVTAVVVQVGEQLLTSYGGRKVVPIEYVDRDIPEDLRHTFQPGIELSPPTAHGVATEDYYGYSDY